MTAPRTSTGFLRTRLAVPRLEATKETFWTRACVSFVVLRPRTLAGSGAGNGDAPFGVSILGDRLVVDRMRFQPVQPVGAEMERATVRSTPPRP